MVLLKEYFEDLNFENYQQITKIMKSFPASKDLRVKCISYDSDQPSIILVLSEYPLCPLSALIFSLMPLYYQKNAIIRKKEFYQPYDNSYQPAEAKYEPKYCPHFCPENVFCFLPIDVHYKLDFFHGSKQ